VALDDGTRADVTSAPGHRADAVSLGGGAARGLAAEGTNGRRDATACHAPRLDLGPVRPRRYGSRAPRPGRHRPSGHASLSPASPSPSPATAAPGWRCRLVPGAAEAVREAAGTGYGVHVVRTARRRGIFGDTPAGMLVASPHSEATLSVVGNTGVPPAHQRRSLNCRNVPFRGAGPPRPQRIGSRRPARPRTSGCGSSLPGPPTRTWCRLLPSAERWRALSV
jgi:hypothetical protein